MCALSVSATAGKRMCVCLVSFSCFDICNMQDHSQQAFLRLDEELCNAGNGCSIITFNCQWDRCPSAEKEVFTFYFSFFGFLLCI